MARLLVPPPRVTKAVRHYCCAIRELVGTSREGQANLNSIELVAIVRNSRSGGISTMSARSSGASTAEN